MTVLKSQKSFLNENKRMQGWNPQKPTKLDRNDTTTISHHPYILCHFANYALCLLVVCIGGLWKAVGWVVLGVECMLMCMGSELCCGWLQCSCYTEHGRYGLS